MGDHTEYPLEHVAVYFTLLWSYVWSFPWLDLQPELNMINQHKCIIAELQSTTYFYISVSFFMFIPTLEEAISYCLKILLMEVLHFKAIKVLRLWLHFAESSNHLLASYHVFSWPVQCVCYWLDTLIHFMWKATLWTLNMIWSWISQWKPPISVTYKQGANSWIYYQMISMACVLYPGSFVEYCVLCNFLSLFSAILLWLLF